MVNIKFGLAQITFFELNQFLSQGEGRMIFCVSRTDRQGEKMSHIFSRFLLFLEVFTYRYSVSRSVLAH